MEEKNRDVSKLLIELQREMFEEGINPIEGLPYDLFLFSTTLFPFVNVDLFIVNKLNQVLLSWRNDKYYGTGWQIPGGIIKMKETIDARIQNTALSEIGTKVIEDYSLLSVGEYIVSNDRTGLDNQLERAHNIALLYKCNIPDDFQINNFEKGENDEGYLKWFDYIPGNILECHKIAYGKIFDEWNRKKLD